ncbi:hypothetical protein BU23DRAFT_303225 [Bimuria novae-zelandiae CBS 107.79]|uniref:Glycosyltransferase family 25 protein n=1 Tax=Bimuria novae-zelandiae CBS 107.79 TaxID=1447943 RepID=A0A6A5UTM4_9PLEO|nr:hypothetical protein BU23DRAFT_303225 [Bimuria novae-zelandiae CBS 107.79]
MEHLGSGSYSLSISPRRGAERHHGSCFFLQQFECRLGVWCIKLRCRTSPRITQQQFKTKAGRPRPPSVSQSRRRAHINAIRTTVEHDLPSALILEDDLDWAVRLREQMLTFALSTRTLTQPLAIKKDPENTYADSSFPDSSSSNKVTEILYDDRPTTIQPSNSAYGDDWDILWLGHCEMQAPTQNTPALSKGRVILAADPSVTLDDTVEVDGEPAQNQTRIYHHVHDPACTLAYAVSQRGARRILYKVSQRNETEAVDDVLKALCDGTGGEERNLVCITTQPNLFSR